MASLHQLNSIQKLPHCLRLLAAGDQLLLTETAVTLVLDTESLQQLPAGVELLALADDLLARGLSEKLPSGVKGISDAQWVETTLEAERVCSW
ncbi:sulfurtransferase complex subunit TusB [Marinospirillum sp.]|uniref:sulfurtransferase complex subunit TusB n=1 Tax=Marinospirillum sp. TaxID=2183934 RepID=UPI00384A4EB2